MDLELDVDAEVDLEPILKQIEEAIVDETTMLRIHAAFAKILDPYVPMDNGLLSQSLEITAKWVRYTQQYAHYMYMGMVYGPNLPIDINGNINFSPDAVIVEWRSIRGQQKTPTGKEINYNTDKHPKATKEWDKVAMSEKLDEFEETVKNILIKRLEELNLG